MKSLIFLNLSFTFPESPLFLLHSLMCGILGAVSKAENIHPASFEEALLRMHQRGPDAHGVFHEDEYYLGQVRLSIIDTSSSANQPFHDPTHRYVLVFNGEIFNYKQLQHQYLNDGSIHFQTHSDTEVLLHLLIRYGADCLPKLSGFFAFAFFDRETKTILLARDRFGKKPLYLAELNEGFFFGSELKSIMPLMHKKEINPEALSLYFQLNYIPPHLSILAGVRKLKPGHVAIYHNLSLTESVYYVPQIQSDKYSHFSYEAAQAELRKRMHHSVEERLISDVPLGAFLSGGIDSSVVVALAAQHTTQLNTYSIGFNNPLFDETPYAKMVADKFKTNHHVFYLSESDYKEELHHILDYIDEPFADSSCIPQYILCKKTKAHVTVALSGDGGDEVFAGYHKHRAEWLIRNNGLLAFAAKTAAPFLQHLPQNKNSRLGEKARQLVKLGAGARLNRADRYLRWASILSKEEAIGLFNEKTRHSINTDLREKHLHAYAQGIKSNDFNEILLADIQLVLPGDMLQKVDWMSMANSVEVRSPFLDYRVVDFALSLPAHYKIDGGFKKKIVQDAFREQLPEALYNRPKKGFEIPLLTWFRTDLNDYIFNNLLQKDFVEAQGIFDYKQIELLRRKLHSASPGYVQATLWGLIVFQHWYKKYMVS